MRERWLGRLVAGETYLAFGLTEPHSGSDAAALRTTAAADGDGYLLSGEKTSVTMLAHAEAMLVTAQTVRDGASLGVSAFLVELSSDGIVTSDNPDTGWRPLGRGVVHFDGVRVPESARIGAEGAAFRSVLAGFDFTRPLLALTGIGCAQACIDETARYVVDREAFGSPLASFEGVSFPLAEHSTTLEAARLLCYAALWLRDEQRRTRRRRRCPSGTARWSRAPQSRTASCCTATTATRRSSVSSSASAMSWPSRSLTVLPRCRKSSSPGNALGGISSPTGHARPLTGEPRKPAGGAPQVRWPSAAEAFQSSISIGRCLPVPMLQVVQSPPEGKLPLWVCSRSIAWPTTVVAPCSDSSASRAAP
jgi:hypothetical protein